MATNKKNAPNIDDSDLLNYPDGRIRDNSGSGDGTPVNRLIYSDLHEYFAKLMRLAGITYNDLPDNETNGYQLVEAAIALAGKNDFVTAMNSAGGVMQISLKLSTLKINEALICKSAFDVTTETTIKGLEASIKNVIVPSPFKNGDYIRLINNGNDITLMRLADGANLDVLVSELNFLKAATEAEEFAGTSLTKATTPYTNQLAFSRRVIGLDSGIFLASLTRNGLLSKEDKAIIDAIPANPVKNIGWFSGVEISGEIVGSSKPRSGQIVSAVVQSAETFSSSFLVTVVNPMSGTNYYVRTMIQSEGDIRADNNVYTPVFKIVSNTQFILAIEEGEPNNQNLKVHLEVVQIS